ncbi:EARP and GARP complex-interacting protein 1-like [Diadema antillarum]|uniref:EARP and GARP complex-interacting protein 1-like n=1 Tax=Diadema antillarum TaxID=105358 RepID=UPI003A8AC3DF
MDDEAPVIYGLEFQARSLTPQVAETDAIRFLVGTQSLKYDNQVHVLDFDEDNNTLNKTVFLHKDGEIWNISSSPAEKDVAATCFNKIVDNKLQGQAAIWRLPAEEDELDTQDVGLHDDSSSSARNLEVMCRLDNSDYGNIMSVQWEPQGDGSKILSLTENKILMWDLEASGTSARMTSSATLEGKGHPKFTSLRWNPHHNNSQVATASDSTVRGWDLRSMQQVFIIENAHSQLVRELDFNPNKQYYMATCGDDCKVKFWDVRNTEAPVMMQSDHSHWVWSVRYNQFHDQLVLSSSSDSRVILTNAASISSEPFGHMDEEDVEDDDEDDDDRDDDEEKHRPKEPMKDGVIATYEEHEDSVYAAEWSTADPWLFASLSYDGRLVINRVPRAEKYKILL